MRTATLISIVVLLCLSATAFATGNFRPAQPTVAVLAESATGVTITIDFPDPTLSSLDRGEAGEALSVEIPGGMPDYEQPGLAISAFTRLIAVPAGCQAVVRIRSNREVPYDATPFVPRDRMQRMLRSVSEAPLVEVGEAGWMRATRVAQVVIHPARYELLTHRVLVTQHLQVDFDFIPDQRDNVPPPDPDRYRSLAFDEFIRGLLLNPSNLPDIQPGGTMVTRGTYLILTDSTLANVTGSFADWKRAKGFNVVVWPIYRPGISAEEIRDSIQSAYDHWARPPEYVLILGDINAPGMQFPAFRIANPGAPNEVDVTDLPYSLLQGADYFPDLFIGRISSDSPNSTIALNAMGRSVKHEQNIANFPVANFHRATLYGGNYGEGNLPVYSPVETVEWLAERLRERGWNGVETFYYRRAGDDVSSSPIVESINRGVNIVAYRGWGDARGSHFPQFYLEDLDRLNNGPLLPVWTSFVCNSGAFGNEGRVLCFGEAVISRGSRANPAGGVVFLGPSDLHTNTRYNNPMLGGFYTGLLYEELRTMGQLTLRAKMELWKSHPAFRGTGEANFVEFYFSVYNILGDPEVSVYLDPPTILRVQHPAQMAIGETDLRMTVTTTAGAPVRGALIHMTKGQETDVSILTDARGVAYAPVNLLTADSLQVTVIAHQAAPYRTKIPVVRADRLIGYESVALNSQDGPNRLLTGIPISMTVSLKNFGSQTVNRVSARLSSPMEGVEIIQASSNFGNIAVGQTAVARTAFSVRLAPNIPSGAQVPFELVILDGDGASWRALFRQPAVNGAVMLGEVTIEGGVVNPGETKGLTIVLSNTGTYGLVGVKARLNSNDGAVTISDNQAVFGDIQPSGSADCSGDPFRISVVAGAAIGRQIAMRMEVLDSDSRTLKWLFFNLTVGQPGKMDPVGPDGYGYYAYDNTDAQYGSHPAYQWLELDPAHGGQGGAQRKLNDDQSYNLNLPFDFKFYGETYRQITICSNGWLSFEETDVQDFNNWPLPSPLGPHALICPFWDDLVGPMNGETRDSLNLFTRYDQAEGRFIVEWSRAIARSGNDIENTETFEVILYNPSVRRTPTGDGEILLQYNQAVLVDRGRELNYASIGIEDWMHTRGLQLTYAAMDAPSCDSITGGRAILITTTPPDDINSVRPGDVVPSVFALAEPYPNPFNSMTRIEFSLSGSGQIELGLYDLSGRMVRALAVGEYRAGRHEIMFGAEDLASGVYMLKLKQGGDSALRKVALIR